MSFLKTAILTIAAASSVVAQDGCTFTATQTITAASAVSSLATCTTVSGSIVLASGVADAQQQVNLGSVKIINGAFTHQNDNVTTQLNAPNLQTVTGAFSLNEVTHLAATQLGSLTQTGDFSLIGVGQLSNLGLTKGLQSIGALTLQNTYLTNLNGISNVSKISDISISGNPLLGNIMLNVPSCNNIDIGSNEVPNGGLSVQLNNLTSANIINIQNATNVTFNSLQTVKSAIFMVSNNFQAFQLPNLTSCGGLIMNSNPSLNNISFPSLTAINGSNATFQFANNSQLASIGGFPNLATVSGAVNFYGSFNNASLSNFKSVAGLFTINSSQNITDTCNQFSQIKTSLQLSPKSSCTGNDASASSTTNTNGGSGTGSGSSATSSSAAFPVMLPTYSLSAGIGAVLLQFFLSF